MSVVSTECWYCGERGPVIARVGDVRVVPHPTPAFGLEGDARPREVGGAVQRDALGAHELVYSGHDDADAPLLRMVASRMTDLRRDPRLRGFGAVRRHEPGRHAVWQLFALPFDVPGSAPAAWRDREAAAGIRLVAATEGTVTLLAWAPRVPFETWVLPRAGRAGFGVDDPAPVAEAAARAREVLGRLLRGAPVDMVLADGEPWRIELVPRLAPPSGAQVATELPLHGTFPEAAAAFWRDA